MVADRSAMAAHVDARILPTLVLVEDVARPTGIPLHIVYDWCWQQGVEGTWFVGGRWWVKHAQAEALAHRCREVEGRAERRREARVRKARGYTAEATRRVRAGERCQEAGLVMLTALHVYELPRAELFGKGRAELTVECRQVLMYLLVEDCGQGVTSAGRLLCRDHSTVLHGHGRVTRALEAGNRAISEVLEMVRVAAMELHLAAAEAPSGEGGQA